MADQQLRGAERALGEQPDDPDRQAAVLQHRLRVGTLSPGRLEVAAYCGYQGALRLIAPDADWGVGRSDQESGHCSSCGWFLVHRVGCPNARWEGWLHGLLRWEELRVPLRAATLAARIGLKLVSAEANRCDSANAAELDRWIGRAETWLNCPCADHGDAWAKAYDAERHRAFPWLPITRMLFHPDACAEAVLALTDPDADGAGAIARLLVINQDQNRTDLQIQTVRGLQAWALSSRG